MKFIAPALLIAATTLIQTASSQLDQTTMLTNLFVGQFDNNAQVLEEKQAGVASPHERLHTIIVRTDIPVLGPWTVFTHQYSQDDPQKIYRQRVYRFSPQDDGASVQMDLVKIVDIAKFGDILSSPSSLASASGSDFQIIEGCSLLFRKGESGWEGRTQDGSCHIVTQGGQPLDVRTTIHIAQGALDIYDEAYATDGSRVWGRDDKEPNRLGRARDFVCWGALQDKDGKWLPAVTSVRTHDQGGHWTLGLRREGEEDATYTADLSQLVRSGGSPVLKIGIHRNGNPKTVSYAWANPEAENLGINLGAIQAGCRVAAK